MSILNRKGCDSCGGSKPKPSQPTRPVVRPVIPIKISI